MKKFIAIVLVAMMFTFTLTGCQSSSNTTAAGTNSTSSAPAENRLEKIKASGKLVMGTSPDFAPSEFIDNSTGTAVYVGSDIELGKYIADYLGVELEVKAMEFSAIQQAIQSGTIDIGIAGFAYSEKRAEAMALTDKFNTNSDDSYQGLLVTAGEAGNYSTADAFAGKKVVAQNASIQQDLVLSQLPADVTFQPVSSISDGVMMVVSGKADAIAVDSDNAKSMLHNYTGIEMADFQFEYGSEGNVAGIKKGEPELLEAVNAAIAEVNEKGLYNQWTEEATELANSLGIDMAE